MAPVLDQPLHASMLSGLPPDGHGVGWNIALLGRGRVVGTPTVFTVARSSGYTTAAFFSKPKFGALQQAEALDFSQAPRGWWGNWPGDRTAADVEAHLRAHRPNLLFVHFADPDAAGHRSGWMTAPYGRAVRAADAAVARVLAAADAAYGTGRYAVIVTADHGGHGRDHGSDDPRDVTIPWIAWGLGVRSGVRIEAPVLTMDTASSVLWLLGLREPPGWQGRTVYEAFYDNSQLPTPNSQEGSNSEGRLNSQVSRNR